MHVKERAKKREEKLLAQACFLYLPLSFCLSKMYLWPSQGQIFREFVWWLTIIIIIVGVGFDWNGHQIRNPTISFNIARCAHEAKTFTHCRSGSRPVHRTDKKTQHGEKVPIQWFSEPVCNCTLHAQMAWKWTRNALDKCASSAFHIHIHVAPHRSSRRTTQQRYLFLIADTFHLLNVGKWCAQSLWQSMFSNNNLITCSCSTLPSLTSMFH